MLKLFNKKKKKSIRDNYRLDHARVLDSKTPFAVKEAFSSLYTNLLYLPIESKCKRIAITSAVAAEGKTYVSINLARSIAMNSPEARVLLIDADMRSPRVYPIINNVNKRERGLSEFLAGIDKEPSVVKSDIDNLSILYSGAETANTIGLFSSGNMKLLIDYCEKNYDYVIFDSTPINIVSDAIVLNDFVDGYIVVTRAEVSNVNSVSILVNNLNRISANIFGFVLTGVDMTRSTKYYSRSKYYYSGYYSKKYGYYSYKYGYSNKDKKDGE